MGYNVISMVSCHPRKPKTNTEETVTVLTKNFENEFEPEPPVSLQASGVHLEAHLNARVHNVLCTVLSTDYKLSWP